MTRFRYLRDPLFLTGCVAYALNRLLLKPHLHWSFLHNHFNDLWLIPCALPPILWLHRKLNLRTHDLAPQLPEIALHLVFWSLLFEWLGPKFMRHTTGDPYDVLAYCIGALLAACYWHRDKFKSLVERQSPTSIRNESHNYGAACLRSCPPLPLAGLEPLGKRRKEFGVSRRSGRTERAGASESLGQGEGACDAKPCSMSAT